VRAERHTVYWSLVVAQREEETAAGDIPQPDGVVDAARGQDVAARMESRRLDETFMTRKGLDYRPRTDIPNAGKVGGHGCRNRFAVGTEAHGRIRIRDRSQVGVAELVEIMPLEAAQIALVFAGRL